ncbi:SMI1/KNR4 family protein [Paenibacillus sp. SI8]|uniref:SMI1/KNR4 family protein n=1 Tax=unclassified Paenibacillus TaxID=185978 RepID=UPI00346706A0
MDKQRLIGVNRLGNKINKDKLSWAQSLQSGDVVAVDVTGKGSLFEVAEIKNVSPTGIELTNGIGLYSDGSIIGSNGGAIVPLTEEIKVIIEGKTPKKSRSLNMVANQELQETLIYKTIVALQKRIGSGGVVFQREGGILVKETFSFAPRTTVEKLVEFTKRTGWNLPIDLHNFFLIHNGAKLFGSDFGIGVQIYGIDEIEQWHNHNMPTGWYPIAHILGDTLFIDGTKAHNLNGYLKWFRSGDRYDQASSLSMNFETWLDFLIVSQGAKYWEWRY